MVAMSSYQQDNCRGRDLEKMTTPELSALTSPLHFQ